MASPFKAFRKHQKQMVVVLTLLAMFAFVVLPIVLQSMGTQPAKNPVVVSTTRYGDIDEMRLDMMLGNRQTLQRFFAQVARSMVLAGGDARTAQMIENAIGPATEEDVVNTWLLASHANELGLVISNDAINEFLRSLTTAQGITAEEVKQILDMLKLSQNQLFDLLKHELLALEFQRLFRISLEGVTPAERWDYYQRLNRKVTAEVMPVAVSRFVDEVPDPDDKTLQEFFEEYKEKPFILGSPEPGFQSPKKIALEYFKADYDKLDEIVAVSDEEVAAYYEANREQLYRREKLPELPELKDEEPAEDSLQPQPESDPPAAEPAEAAPETETSPQADAPDAAETQEKPAAAPAAQEKPAEDEKPAPEPKETKKPTTEPKETEKPTTEPKETEKPATEPKADSNKSDKSDETSALEPASPFRLASLLQEEEATAEAETGPALAPAAEDAAEEPPAAASEEPAIEEPEAPEIGLVEYVALDEVADEIRRRLAEEKIKDVLDRLRDKMARYHDEWIVYDSLPEEEKPNATPPAELDMAQMAQQNRLSAHKTELISAYEVADLDIGKSSMEGNVPFATYAFETLPEYRPAVSQDDEGNHYLFWKPEAVDEQVPEWDDPNVREAVKQTWKEIQARQPAKALAERLAEFANQAEHRGKPLAEVLDAYRNTTQDAPAWLSEVEAADSEPFSWMTYGAFPAWWAQMPPRISEVKARAAEGQTSEQDAVEMPGNDFMRAVSRLEKDEAGVGMNQPQTAAYLVRVTDVNPLPEVLWRLFVAEDFNRYGRVAAQDRFDAVNAWRDGIKKSADFEWEREPFRATRR